MTPARRDDIATPDSFVALMYHNVGPEGETYPDLSPSATSYFVSRSAFGTPLIINP